MKRTKAETKADDDAKKAAQEREGAEVADAIRANYRRVQEANGPGGPGLLSMGGFHLGTYPTNNLRVVRAAMNALSEAERSALHVVVVTDKKRQAVVWMPNFAEEFKDVEGEVVLYVPRAVAGVVLREGRKAAERMRLRVRESYVRATGGRMEMLDLEDALGAEDADDVAMVAFDFTGRVLDRQVVQETREKLKWLEAALQYEQMRPIVNEAAVRALKAEIAHYESRIRAAPVPEPVPLGSPARRMDRKALLEAVASPLAPRTYPAPGPAVLPVPFGVATPFDPTVEELERELHLLRMDVAAAELENPVDVEKLVKLQDHLASVQNVLSELRYRSGSVAGKLFQ